MILQWKADHCYWKCYKFKLEPELTLQTKYTCYLLDILDDINSSNLRSSAILVSFDVVNLFFSIIISGLHLLKKNTYMKGNAKISLQMVLLTPSRCAWVVIILYSIILVICNWMVQLKSLICLVPMQIQLWLIMAAKH